jgi:hypothetical protein
VLFAERSIGAELQKSHMNLAISLLPKLSSTDADAQAIIEAGISCNTGG